MQRRIAAALAAAAVLLAACGGAGPAISDPREIMRQGLEATAGLTSVHLEVALDGTATIPDLGGQMNLGGTSLEGDFDIENKSAQMSFAVPAMFGLSGEMILVDDAMYIRSSLTGELWSKQEVTSDNPVAGAADPTEMLAQLDELLAKEGVELAKLDDVECGDRQCYAVRLTIPADVLADAGDAAAMDPTELVGEALVLELLFDRQELWLTEVTTALGQEDVAELTVTLSLSSFNQSVDIEAPPEDEVTEGGEFLPF